MIRRRKEREKEEENGLYKKPPGIKTQTNIIGLCL
jgi:hypothetical protein